LQFTIGNLQFGIVRMNEDELIERTKQFALRIMRVVRALPKTLDARAIGDQMARSAPSVHANYRAACKSRLRAEFISRLGTVEEEADETAGWLDLLITGQILSEKKLRPLLMEARELTAIFASSRKTAAQNEKLQIANRKLQIRRRSDRRSRPRQK
jgi:four helix bundle protein